jgi:diguanylate cyclase (GGDEF)-like protein
LLVKAIQHGISALGSGITKRFAVLFVLLVGLLLAVAAVYARYSWDEVRRERLEHLQQLAELGAASSQVFLQRYTERAVMLADELRARGATRDPAAALALMRRYQAADANIAAINLFAENGALVTSTAPGSKPGLPPHTADPVFVEDFERTQSTPGPLIGRVRFGARVDDWILPVRMRVPSERGPMMLSLVVPLSRHQAMWRGLSFPGDWAIGLVRDDGYLQSRHPPPTDTKSAFLEPHRGALLDALRRDGFPARGWVEGKGSLIGATQALVAFKRLDDYPITCYARMPAAEIWSAWWRHMRVPGALFGISLIAIVAAGLWAVRQQREREAERDAAERSLRASEAALKRQTILLEQSQRTAQIGAWELDVERGELYWTAQTYRIHEVSSGEYAPTWDSALSFFASDSAPFIRDAMQRALKTGEPWDLELQLITARGKRIWVRCTGAVEMRESHPVRAWGSFQDVTQRRRSEEQIIRLAHYDELTGLPNRNLFSTHLSHAISRALRNDSSLAVLFIDLDRFKHINDALGHDVGDEVLQIVAGRLGAALRASDILARLGGDEFVVIAEDIAHPDAIAGLGRKLLAAVDQPVVLRDQDFTLSASIGVSLYPNDGTDPQTLIKNADTAMYRAKEQGRNNLQFYSAHMGSANVSRLALETQLKRAVAEGNQFIVHYQPRVSARDGRITGAECLVRWVNPERGLVSPAEFIPLAEELGLIRDIGNWVLRSAVQQAAEWRRAGLPRIPVAVNISAQQLYAASFLDGLRDVLLEHRLDPDAIELEVTESVMMQRTQQVADVLNAIRTLGVPLSVDDFGTGYSSLAYLKRLPIYSLKIDRSFVHDVPHDVDDVTIVRAIIALAHNLRMQVVAEGVETGAQLDFLRGEGCDEIQGFLVSRPVPAEVLAPLLRAGRMDFALAAATA